MQVGFCSSLTYVVDAYSVQAPELGIVAAMPFFNKELQIVSHAFVYPEDFVSFRPGVYHCALLKEFRAHHDPIPSNGVLQMGSHTYAEGRPLIHSSAQICRLFPNPINGSKLQVPSRFINSYVASISSTFYECFLESWFITDWLPICRVHTF